MARKPTPRDYLLASLLVGAVTLLGELLEHYLAPFNLLMFYLLAVVLTARTGGRGPAAVCAGLSVLAFDFFFVPPRYTFAIHQMEHLVTFAALLVVALVVGDLTARVDEQARQANRALLLQERERLQSTILNSISHDLQTPLTSILGCLDGLLDPVVQSDEAVRQTLLQSAREQTDRLRRLVDDLLEMTRVEARQNGLHKEPCDLSDLVGSALGRLEEAYRDRQVILDVAADFPLIAVDFVPFSQVIYNLLENAAKYSPSGSTVEVSARMGKGAEVRISDHGPGIPLPARERVFEKFYRLSPTTPGTGLGLPICRGLIELHGGSIRIEDRPGWGCTFVLEIPA